MKKINNLLMTISMIVVLIVGVFGFIYDYLIWDKSILPVWMFDAFAIPGYIALAVLIITLILQKKLN